MNCPGCDSAMQERALEAHLGRTLVVDICEPCQWFWFDGHESLQLTPASTRRLFELASAQSDSARRASRGRAACPRCGELLRRVRDIQGATRFEYLKCPDDHGRLLTFVEFLKQKAFVKPLTAAQLAELRHAVRSVNCSNCGAAIDLAGSSACQHCGTPISVLYLQRP